MFLYCMLQAWRHICAGADLEKLIIQANTSAPHPGYDGRSAGPTSYGRPAQPGIGFTPGQLEVLRNQILAFRSIKVGAAVAAAKQDNHLVQQEKGIRLPLWI